MMGPISNLVNVLPTLGIANVSLQKIEQLGLSRDNDENILTKSAEKAPAHWHKIEMREITHTYKRENDDCEFILGPLDFCLERGELTYIIGGNGSGKSTFAKLVTGLYIPDQGQIYIDGEKVDESNRERYRQYFSAVFSDFYLFNRLLGIERENIHHNVYDYLAKLQLEQKVTIENDFFSTINLSQGQRKRLALLITYLEDREVYVFDEWASDQDPAFKEIFYKDLLPELKQKGKAILVITHDDRYFSLADRVLKFENGQLIDVRINDSKLEVMGAGLT
jgi:putative ATP-binding cassette transporter